MITLSKNSVVPIKTLIHGYSPYDSGDRICPVIRARKAKPQISAAEKRERREAAGKDSGLSSSTLNWINDFTKTGRFRRTDTGVLESLRRAR
jgi:hypothetical protein